MPAATGERSLQCIRSSSKEFKSLKNGHKLFKVGVMKANRAKEKANNMFIRISKDAAAGSKSWFAFS